MVVLHLSGPERGELRELLQRATTRDDLRRALAEAEPTRDYDDLVAPGKFPNELASLIGTADDGGWLGDLLDLVPVLTERPDLRQNAESLRLWGSATHRPSIVARFRHPLAASLNIWLAVVAVGVLLATMTGTFISITRGPAVDPALTARLDEVERTLEAVTRPLSQQQTVPSVPLNMPPNLPDSVEIAPEDIGSLISTEAIDLIMLFEVGDVENRAFTPTVLSYGAASGISIGIGYDLGFTTIEKFRQDWSPHLPADVILRLEPAIGKRGAEADALLLQLADIEIAPDVARQVFIETTLKWAAEVVLSEMPNARLLPPKSLGALVSLTVNRGNGYAREGDRFAEMRQIRLAVEEGRFDAVPLQIRKMEQLWPGLRGLQQRREAEAALFEKGLIEVAIAALQNGN